MIDAIDRTALKDCLVASYCSNCDNWSDEKCRFCLMNDALIAIDEAAELKAAIESTWVYDRPHHWRCGHCGRPTGVTAKVHPYCPVCGSHNGLAKEQNE